MIRALRKGRPPFSKLSRECASFLVVFVSWIMKESLLNSKLIAIWLRLNAISFVKVDPLLDKVASTKSNPLFMEHELRNIVYELCNHCVERVVKLLATSNPKKLLCTPFARNEAIKVYWTATLSRFKRTMTDSS